MPLRVPPGRAGRTWLAQRLAIARRAAELLDEKRQALLTSRARLAEEVAAARGEWWAAAEQAAVWLGRSVLAGDGRQIELVAAHVEGPAELDVTWSRVMGVRHPASARLRSPPSPSSSALGGSSSLALAVAAHGVALQAGARVAAAEMALSRVDAELARTVRRLRALERRWIPEHERALAERELVLEEREREDAGRARWARGRLARGEERDGAPSGAPEGHPGGMPAPPAAPP